VVDAIFTFLEYPSYSAFKSIEIPWIYSHFIALQSGIKIDELYSFSQQSTQNTLQCQSGRYIYLFYCSKEIKEI
jgi:hypothetical protein